LTLGTAQGAVNNAFLCCELSGCDMSTLSHSQPAPKSRESHTTVLTLRHCPNGSMRTSRTVAAGGLDGRCLSGGRAKACAERRGPLPPACQQAKRKRPGTSTVGYAHLIPLPSSTSSFARRLKRCRLDCDGAIKGMSPARPLTLPVAHRPETGHVRDEKMLRRRRGRPRTTERAEQSATRTKMDSKLAISGPAGP
jgi:hypothetical protein